MKYVKDSVLVIEEGELSDIDYKEAMAIIQRAADKVMHDTEVQARDITVSMGSNSSVAEMWMYYWRPFDPVKDKRVPISRIREVQF
jgi:hypothetical protein